MLVLAIADLRNLLRRADITAAMSVEGLLGTDRVFAADLHALRPQPGQRAAAANMRALLGRQRRSSPATAGRRTRACRTRTRCAARRRSRAPRATRSRTPRGSPSASSPRRSTTRWSPATAASSPTATSTARRSATCSTSWRSRSPTSRAMAERRTDRFLDAPAATACRRSWPTIPGVDSGYMIAQYTQAALVSELKRLAVPGERRLHPELARCRRTTSRWAGPPGASCAARSTA